MVLAMGFGAIHALTPGHGKTLVAAYLVAERGTVWHAVLLGIVTTLSHTGVVIVLAFLVGKYFSAESLESGLQLGGGILVVGLGFWLFLKRLSGGPDHVHLFGDSHHHHDHSHAHADHSHGHGADHYHDAEGRAHPGSERVGGWGILVLGVVGGMVPCWDAILILCLAPKIALPLVLAFSAGLASTLVAIGVAVVYIKGFSESRWGQGKVIRALPIISAAFITAMGLWMCYRSLNSGA
jgi:nickel/cobalt exporter